MELDPLDRRRAADQREVVLGEVEQDHVADHVAVRGHRHELLGLVDREVLEAVDRQVLEQREGVGSAHVELDHVVALVEQHRGLGPGALLVAPVRILGRHARIDVRADLLVAQEVDDAADRIQLLLKGLFTHGSLPLLEGLG